MSPEFRFLVIADLRSVQEAEETRSSISRFQGVERVQILPKALENSDRQQRARYKSLSQDEAIALLGSDHLADFSLGKIATILRISRAWTLVDVTRNGGPSIKSVSLIERDLKEVGAYSVIQLARAYGFSEDHDLTKLLLEKDKGKERLPSRGRQKI